MSLLSSSSLWWLVPPIPTWLALSVVMVTLLWYQLHRKYYTYFDRHGIPQTRRWAVFPFGHLVGVRLLWSSLSDLFIDTYAEFNDRSIYGFYSGRTPIVCVREPRLIQQVLLQHFDHFADHQQLIVDARLEPLVGRSIFALSGDKWRDMRATLVPAFTGARVAAMFERVERVAARSGAEVRRRLHRAHSEQTEAPLRDLLTRYVTDVTASLTFGTETNSFDERNDAFYRIVQRTLHFRSLWRYGRRWLAVLLYVFRSPWQLRIYEPDIVEHFSQLVLGTLAQRRRTHEQRSDVIQTLLEAQRRYADRAQTTLAFDELGAEDMRGERRREWDDDELVAQGFMVFLAGHETVSLTLVFVVYELAMNAAVQRRLTEEVDAMRRRLGEAGGRALEYRDLERLPYLDMVISEVLRKWPIAMRLTRQCSKDFTLRDERTGAEVHTRLGDTIYIPVIGLHRDAAYFPDPERFDPERFSAERAHEIQPFTYLPFGAGPRNCFASRFALMQIKVLVYHMLSEFALAAKPSAKDVRLTVRENGVFLIENVSIRLVPRV